MLVENPAPARWRRRLGYEDLSEINPGLVMVRVSGYADGTLQDQAGFGSIGEAMGGIRYVTGYPDRPPPRVGISLGDSLAATFGALGAGRHSTTARRKAAEARWWDVGIYEGPRAHGEHHPEYALTGHIRGHRAILPSVAPSNTYPTGDGTTS